MLKNLGLNALQITQERQSKRIKELKKEITVVRLKGSHYYLRKELPVDKIKLRKHVLGI